MFPTHGGEGGSLPQGWTDKYGEERQESKETQGGKKKKQKTSLQLHCPSSRISLFPMSSALQANGSVLGEAAVAFHSWRSLR